VVETRSRKQDAGCRKKFIQESRMGGSGGRRNVEKVQAWRLPGAKVKLGKSDGVRWKVEGAEPAHVNRQ